VHEHFFSRRPYNRVVKTLIYVAAEVDRALLDRLGKDSRIECHFRPANTETELIAAAGVAEILVSRYHNPLSAKVLSALPRLRLIVQGTSGLDNIDLNAASQRQVTVIGIPGENANAVAEYVIGCILALTRAIPSYSAAMRGGLWTRNDCATNRELKSHRLGIIGLGRVGSRVAALAGSLGLPTTAFDPYLSNSDFVGRGSVRSGSLEELLGASSIVTVHAPLTPQTRGMIGTRELSLLAPGSIVINAARGPIVDLDSVLSALHNDELGGAAIDVFSEEPPERVWPSDPRLILTPHVAGCTGDSKEAIGERVYEKIDHYLRNRS